MDLVTVNYFFSLFFIQVLCRGAVCVLVYGTLFTVSIIVIMVVIITI